MRKEKYENLYASDCEVVELYRNKAVIKISEKENLIAKKIGKVKKGDKVKIYKKEIIGRFEEILIYISPLYYLFLGFVFGFLFYNDLYHYLLILGMTVIGFAQLFGLRTLFRKATPVAYIAVTDTNI